MKYYIIHPDHTTLIETGIKENDCVMTLEMNLTDIKIDGLERGKFAVVAPGNSFGLMDGGYDLAIINAFGEHVQTKIQDIIVREYFGELPVGCAVSCDAISNPSSFHDIPTEEYGNYPLIVYAPTMQVPMSINGTANVYLATLAAIREAKKRGCDNVLLPLMGAGTGGMPLVDAGYQIMEAIKTSEKPPKEITWDHAMERHSAWHEFTHIPE